MPKRSRPNFLFFMVDQMRFDHVGFGGNGIVQTPNLDALAALGMVYDKAYVATPTCMPNRASLLTGLMPSRHGSRVNGIPLRKDLDTFVRKLKGSGYKTGLVGKAHFQPFGIVKDPKGSSSWSNLSFDFEIPWDSWESIALHERRFIKLPEDYYGFDEVDLVLGHSDMAGGHYTHWLRDQGMEPEALRGRNNALEICADWHQVYKPLTPEPLYPTSYISERARQRLFECAKESEPFFLMVSFPDPHHPFTPPGDYYGKYPASEMETPRTFFDSHRRSMPHYRAMIAERGVSRTEYGGWSPTVDQYKAAVSAEFGMIELIDKNIGNLLGFLNDLGMADNTVVVFTSDHGDMFGDHGVMLKHAMHYDACLHVPLIVYCPGAAATRCSALVNTLDVSSTILALAGCDAIQGSQGQLLPGVLADAAVQPRASLLVEEDQVEPVFGLSSPLRMRTVITKEGRLTLYDGYPHGELFNHVADPDEMGNLYGLTKARRFEAEMRNEMLGLLIRNSEDWDVPRFIG